MNEDQIKALIAETVKSQVAETLKATLTGDMLTNALKPLAQGIREDVLAEVEDVLTKPDPQPKPSDGDPAPAPDMATKAEIARLKKQLEDESKARKESEAQREAGELRGAILAELGAKGVKQQSAAMKLLQDQMQFKRENGSWFTGEGDGVKTLSDAVAGFLETEVGGLFVAPSGTQGAGTQEARPVTTAADEPGRLSADDFAAAFGF